MLPIGKVPNDILERVVFKRTGAKLDRVVLGPAIGEDAAVVDMGDRYVVIASDPITGASSGIGWYAVHVNANDVAVRGATPLFLTLTILLPKDVSVGLLDEVVNDAHSAAMELGVSIVGGHTEVVSFLSHPVVCGTMIGEVEKGKLVTTGGAKPGDVILITKHAGLEGASIIASERYNELVEVVGRGVLERAKSFSRMLSVVKEALALNEGCKVTAMHDPTEGGVIGGLIELSIASNVGFRVNGAKIPVAEETRRICEVLGVNPLRLISSGVLLATVDEEAVDDAVKALKNAGVKFSIIGEVVDEGRIIEGPEGKVYLGDEIVEELWVALEREID